MSTCSSTSTSNPNAEAGIKPAHRGAGVTPSPGVSTAWTGGMRGRFSQGRWNADQIGLDGLKRSGIKSVPDYETQSHVSRRRSHPGRVCRHLLCADHCFSRSNCRSDACSGRRRPCLCRARGARHARRGRLRRDRGIRAPARRRDVQGDGDISRFRRDVADGDRARRPRVGRRVRAANRRICPAGRSRRTCSAGGPDQHQHEDRDAAPRHTAGGDGRAAS